MKGVLSTGLGARLLERGSRGLLTPGRFVGLRRRRPFAPGGGPAVVVAPHPDDETVGAGGVAALHAMAGDEVTWVVVTDGSGSREGDLTPERMSARRRSEVAAASRKLGIARLICLGFPERSWSASEVSAALAPVLADARIVYAPSCVDVHRDHVAVARVVAQLVRDDQSVRVYEVSVPLTPVLVNCVADISSVARRKADALSAFASQRGALAPILRLRAYRRVLYGSADSEVFWAMSAAAYRAIMRCHLDEVNRFRPMTLRPADDVAAFTRGLRARRRLWAAALVASSGALRP